MISRQRVAIATLLSSLCCSPGPPDATAGKHVAIIGAEGDAALPPGMLAIVDANIALLCSAVAIDKRVLLTAAHCVARRKRDMLRVTTARDLETASVASLLTVSDVIVHPSYDATGVVFDAANADIAIVRVTQTVDFAVSSYERKRDVDHQNASVVIAGYGRVSRDDYRSDTRLRVATTHVATSGRNELRLAKTAARKCIGDSGGGTFIRSAGKLLLIGLAARTDRACSDGSVETRIAGHAPWIERSVRALSNAAKENEPKENDDDGLADENGGCAMAASTSRLPPGLLTTTGLLFLVSLAASCRTSRRRSTTA